MCLVFKENKISKTAQDNVSCLQRIYLKVIVYMTQNSVWKKCRPPHTHDCMCTHSLKHTLKSIWTDFKAEERILWASASSGDDLPSVTLTYTPVNSYTGGWSNRNIECCPIFSKDRIKNNQILRDRQTDTYTPVTKWL